MFDRLSNPGYPATVSTFRLDTYETTVGRFRSFVASYPSNKPLAGSGKNPNNPADPGWDESWPLPVDRAALVRVAKRGRAWTDTPGPNENLPISALDWYIAYAFCIWDGGRLPTDAEWNYAAAGGAEQRYFPWSAPPESRTVDGTYAVFNDGPLGTVVVTAHVGSRSPRGDGKWGHADLGGNLWEWVQDWRGVRPSPCLDCANLTNPDQPDLLQGLRITRGGSMDFLSGGMTTTFTGSLGPLVKNDNVGVRCARNP